MYDQIIQHLRIFHQLFSTYTYLTSNDIFSQLSLAGYLNGENCPFSKVDERKKIRKPFSENYHCNKNRSVVKKDLSLSRTLYPQDIGCKSDVHKTLKRRTVLKSAYFCSVCTWLFTGLGIFKWNMAWDLVKFCSFFCFGERGRGRQGEKDRVLIIDNG